MNNLPEGEIDWKSPKELPHPFEDIWILLDGDIYEGYLNRFKLYRIRGLNKIEYVAAIDGWYPKVKE